MYHCDTCGKDAGETLEWVNDIQLVCAECAERIKGCWHEITVSTRLTTLQGERVDGRQCLSCYSIETD